MISTVSLFLFSFAPLQTPPTTIPGIVVCEPGQSGVIVCPCGNTPSGLGRGCNNSLNTGGAMLTATGINSLSADSVQLNCTGIGTATASCSGSNTNIISVLFEGSTPIPNGIAWGDGVLCCGGPFFLLNAQIAAAGTYHFPIPGTTGLHQAAISAGDPLVVGSTRWYFVAYRDTCPSFCPTSVRQKSNSYMITWGP